METEELIEASVFCTYHEVAYTFITSLEEHGLIQLKPVKQQKYIPHSQLVQLEKMIRLHRELDINIEGIEAVLNILQQVEQLQQENRSLKNKLRIYL